MHIHPRPWLMLAAMVIAQASTTIIASTPAFLIPYLSEHEGMGLATAGMLAGAPNLGFVLSLVAWGIATDRFGERRVLLAGLSATVVSVAVSTVVEGFVALGLVLVAVGAVSACTNSASGRLITGWFPAERRGLAMGIRQSCQPLGIAVAAIAVPPIAEGIGLHAALALGGVLALISLLGCLVVVSDPERLARVATATAASPYRSSSVLVRIHAVSMLLVVPQFALATFGLVWFTVGFGWSALAAGSLVAVSQFAGAAGRVVVGAWSDRVSSRFGPLRIIAYSGVAALLIAATLGWWGWSVAAAIAFVIASCISVADNGLSFTAVAEIAGGSWAGRALGIQNTGQFLASALVGPIVGGLIGLVGMPAAFALVAVTPALAVPLVPPAAADPLSPSRLSSRSTPPNAGSSE